MSQPVLEVAFEKASVGPKILTISRRLTVLVRATITVSIDEFFSPFSMF